MFMKLNEKFYSTSKVLNVKKYEILEKIYDEKGEDPDGGLVTWLVKLGIAVGILILVYNFLQAFFPGFLNQIFNRVSGFFA